MLMKRYVQSLLSFCLISVAVVMFYMHRLNPPTIISYQSEQGGRNQNNNISINNITSENGAKEQTQTLPMRTSASVEKQIGDNQYEINKSKKNPTKRCTLLQLKNKHKGEYYGKSQCVKKQSLTLDCNSPFQNPMTIDIDGACKKSTIEEICKITGFPDTWNIRCNISVCNKTVYLGRSKLGTIHFRRHRTRQSLQSSIYKLILESSERYCLITCKKPIGYSESQLLNFPPAPQRFGLSDKRKSQKLINFNFIMLDSISRTHFYRTLPRSAKVLDTIAAERPDTMVLDFELVQGIRSRTFETLQALFSGYVNPYEIPFGPGELSNQKLNIAKWLLPLKKLGFSSLWLEDMCPFYSWGLSRDLLVVDKMYGRNNFYMEFLEACRKAGIDDIGNIFSTCRILRYNGAYTPFDSRKLCFNGRHQHEYMFSYLKTFQRTMRNRSKPFISFMVSSIAHEAFGERVMFLDKDLAEHLKFSSDITKTITIVFSDHGNRFNGQRHFDGRLEVFNPFLFMIIPKAVQSMFSASQMQALEMNQYRLISILDLHYTISYIIGLLQIENDSKTNLDDDVDDFNKQFNVSKYGLLTEISAKRTCSLIPRIMPNLCICKGYDISSENPSYNHILAVYLVDRINDQIQRQLANFDITLESNISRTGGFRNCKRMKLQKIGNVEEHLEDDYSRALKMDLYVETDGQSVEEMFFVTLLKINSTISMIKYDRVTSYAKYSSCCDKGVDLTICICSDENKNNSDSNNKNALKSILYTSLEHNVTSIRVNEDACLHVIEQFNRDGILYEAFNDCEFSLTLRLYFRPVNITLTTSKILDAKMFSGDIKFLAAGFSSEKWSCNVNVDISF